MSPINVSQIHRRDIVLGMLIPKILGILWDAGQLPKLGPNPLYEPDIDIGAYYVQKDRIGLSVWSPSHKVLSLHLVSHPTGIDPKFFRYQSGRCGVLGWRRGTWEDRIIDSSAQPRVIRQAFTVGLAPGIDQPTCRI